MLSSAQASGSRRDKETEGETVIGKAITDNGTKDHGNKPPLFSGNRAEYQNFIHKLKIWLKLNEATYDTDIKKILATITYLSGEAAEWGRNWFESKPPRSATDPSVDYGTFDQFLQLFASNYKPTDQRRLSMDKLDSLQQGSMKANEFVTKFKLLAREAGILGATPPTSADDIADTLLRDRFQKQMNTRLWQKLMEDASPPTTFAEWCDRAIARDDQWHTAIRRQPNFQAFRGAGRGRGPPINNVSIRRLTDEQYKEAMAKGTCFYCQGQGHIARECPKKKNQPRKKPFQKKPVGKLNPKEAFSHIKQIISDMDQDEYEEFSEQMNQLNLRPEESF
jgi:hypothetical protein